MIIIVLFIFEVAGDLVAEQEFEIDLYWVVILSVGFVVWVVLRTLKKKTNLLNVAGR